MNTVTGLRLPPTLVYDYPSSSVLAAHLRTEILGEESAAGAVAGVPSTTVAVADDPIAIVGMSRRFPGRVRGCRRSCGGCWSPGRTRSPRTQDCRGVRGAGA
ncbi:6-deoxyerythronolide-B synthase EryA1, modules 1 and 2 [Streptomyces antimycoticus]